MIINYKYIKAADTLPEVKFKAWRIDISSMYPILSNWSNSSWYLYLDGGGGGETFSSTLSSGGGSGNEESDDVESEVFNNWFRALVNVLVVSVSLIG